MDYSKMSPEHLKELRESEERTRIAFEAIANNPKKYADKGIEEVYRMVIERENLADIHRDARQLEEVMERLSAIEEAIRILWPACNGIRMLYPFCLEGILNKDKLNNDSN